MDLNTELKLLKGSSFFVDDIEIKPLKLKDIVDIDYFKYLQYLNIYILELSDIFTDFPDEFKGITIFDLLLNSEIDDLLENLINSIYLFFKPKDLKVNNNEIILDNKIIHRDNWNSICKIIKMQNCVQKIEKETYNPANDKAREIIKKIEANKKNIPQKEFITLASMISGVAWKSHNLNIIDIWDITIYQLYDALNRLNLIDDYQFTLNGIYAGTVDGKKIDMKKINWIQNYQNSKEEFINDNT